jgi:hypothetical protein
MGRQGSRRANPANLQRGCDARRAAAPSRRVAASAACLQWSVGLPLRAVAPMAGETACSRPEGWFILGGARWCGLLDGVAMRSLQRRCWALGPSLGGGLTPDLKLVGCRRCWWWVRAVLQGSGVAVDAGAAQASFLISDWFLCGRDGRRQRSGRGGFRSA